MAAAAEAKGAASIRGLDLLDQVDYRLVQTAEEKEQVYNLRYKAYLREGAVLPSGSGRVTDEYDDLPNSFIFGVYVDGELYSSIRISILSSQWRQSLSAGMFSALINTGPDRGQAIVGPTRFVAEPAKLRPLPPLP